MVLNSKLLMLIIPAVLITGIGASMVAGYWDTGADRQPTRYQDDELNPYDPQSISGSYSVSEISKFFNIPIDVIYEAFSISDTFDPTTFKAKNLGSIYEPTEFEIGTEALQAFVALYNDLPYSLVDVYLPADAVTSILDHTSTLSEDQKAYLNSHTLEVVPLDPSKVSFTEEETTVDFAVKGPTSIQEVIDAGMTKTEFETIVKAKVSYTNQTVKDFCIEKGLSFSEIKVALEEALSK
ncbi:MAG: hypothetical protein WBL80_01450 [Erysipelotrichaceae bacterium]